MTPHQVVRAAPGEQLRLPSTTVRVLSVRAADTDAGRDPAAGAAPRSVAADSSAPRPAAGTAVPPPPGSRVWLLELASSSPISTCGVTLADASGRRYGANPDELGTVGSPGCATATEQSTTPAGAAAGSAGGSAGDGGGRDTVQLASFLLPADRLPVELVIDYPTNAPYLGVLGIAQSTG